MAVSVAKKRAVIARDGGFCLLALANCRGEAQTADHRANRGHGGAGDVLDDGVNLIAACSICNAEKETATGVVLLDLLERGLRVLHASTHRKTLERVWLTPILMLDGSWRMPMSYDDWRPATSFEIARHLEAVAA
ncbi:HNH endonuclease [Microbacterium stercoris]|uniref:HNH endonuclease n=1 Tax=Microbacterium stercoris TaxID=2820289 RepID=A0A939QIV3_9MICO|nr:hypothetical protein [Microbacterium stercoris]MBO3663712.1 hypothetical protein [Microbacterium stercoris]